MPTLPSWDAPIEQQRVDLELDEFVLDPDNQKLPEIDIADATVGSDLLLSIEQGSTFTLNVQDDDLELSRGEFLFSWTWGKNVEHRDEAAWINAGNVIRASLGGHRFVLVNSRKPTGTRVIDLMHEDEVSWELKQRRGTRKAYRDEVTRAEFVKQLCDAAGVKSYIPELHKRQPITRAADQVKEPDRKATASAGLSSSSGITIKGAEAKPTQLRRIERCSDVAASLGEVASAQVLQRARQAMHCAAIGESAYGENTGTRGTTFQTQAISEAELEKQAYHFLTGGRSFLAGGAIGLVKKNPNMSLGEVASKVEISDQGGAYYQKFAREAVQIDNAYSGSSSGGGSITVEKRYAFARGRNETSWDCIQRLADEVGWVAFVRSGRLWFLSEEDLAAQKPELTAAIGKKGVDDIGWEVDIDARNPVSEVEITFYADRWTALPGMVITIDDKLLVDGEWLVVEIQGTAYRGDLKTARCRKAIREKNEPAPEADTLDVGGNAAAGGSGTAGAATGTWQWPVSPHPVTSGFGARSAPTAGASTNHDGIDIGVGTGTRCNAVDGGTIVKAGQNGGYGLYVEIDHGRGVHSFYGHLSKIDVSVGDSVRQGQQIARTGNTGTSSGPHLHLGCHVNGRAVDPRSRLPR